MSGPTKPKNSAKKKAKAAPKRDNFLGTTTQKLRDSAGNVCSFPGCYVHTHGAKSNGEGTVGIGVACHIKAAAPGGPRYDEHQSPEERKHFDNGIWMCQTHSKLIDADESPYSVTTLLQWKRDAEARSNSLLNQKSFTEKEVKAAAGKESADLLHRFINRSDDPLLTPVAEIMKGYESNLANLDPRFTVEVNKIGSAYTHLIRAVDEDVNVNLVIEDVDKIEGYLAAEKAFLEEGRELTISGAHFKIEGSKLFEAFHSGIKGIEQAVLTMSAPRKEARATLFVRTPEGHETVLDVFPCYYYSGSLRTVFEGSALDGFFKVKAYCSHEGQDAKFDLLFNLEAWVGKNILNLPRFHKLANAAKLLDTGRFVIEIEIAEIASTFSSQSNSHNEVLHAQVQFLIDYIGFARAVAQRCAEPLIIKNTMLNPATYKFLRNYARLGSSSLERTLQPTRICVGPFAYHEGASFEEIDNNPGGKIIRITEGEGQKFEVFGSIIQVPRVVRLYSNVEYVFYTEIDGERNSKVEVHATSDTTLSTFLEESDVWSVCQEVDITPASLEQQEPQS
ncbi:MULTISPECIES: hypothetical protein [Pseudomonas]|nr:MULTISPECIES: hypothetical protein [Pseudomonas]MBH3412154.1 hypothetical protein [Pseudomonas putida]ORL68782.1 hypothetical protein B7H19_14355 [Pseudomonas putida]GLO21471.1 hypothetical protein PPUJ20188_48680 [Pseudomonas putida]HDS0997275.1 hypothetical protein [Pseudomonas putida]HDS1763751.1 hypothetical protein [Pseudomonas putida]